MASTAHKLRILLIDDDPVIIRLAEGVLTANGYAVITAAEAPKGLELAMQPAGDLIILDVMMPIINGFNICRLIKNQPQCRRIPVILLTSRSDEQDRQIGKDVGADAYLAKPLNTDQLLEAVARLAPVRGADTPAPN